MKTCCRCRSEKDDSDFPLLKNSKVGLHSYCKDCFQDYHRQHSKQHYQNNKDYYKKRNKLRYQLKKEECNMASAKWRQENREKAREIQRRHDRKVRSTPMGRVTENISSEISRSMKRGPKGRGHWETLVGYTKGQLKEHLEKQFTPEMSWENYGVYWHIDHKIPLAIFNYSTPADIDFKRAWSLENLQPLSATENIKKRCKINRPFQPALSIAA
jgi:hypothetical protein